MKTFINNGFNTLSASAQGKYSERTNDIIILRHEMLNGNFGTFSTDRENLMKDKKAISGDIGRAFSRVSYSIKK